MVSGWGTVTGAGAVNQAAATPAASAGIVPLKNDIVSSVGETKLQTQEFGAVAAGTSGSVYKDVNSSWSKEAINALTSMQILQGTGDRTFEPKTQITGRRLPR